MKKNRLLRLLILLRAYNCDSCPIYSEGCAGKYETEEGECYALFRAYGNEEYPFEEATDDSD